MKTAEEWEREDTDIEERLDDAIQRFRDVQIDVLREAARRQCADCELSGPPWYGGEEWWHSNADPGDGKGRVSHDRCSCQYIYDLIAEIEGGKGAEDDA